MDPASSSASSQAYRKKTEARMTRAAKRLLSMGSSGWEVAASWRAKRASPRGALCSISHSQGKIGGSVCLESWVKIRLKR